MSRYDTNMTTLFPFLYLSFTPLSFFSSGSEWRTERNGLAGESSQEVNKGWVLKITSVKHSGIFRVFYRGAQASYVLHHTCMYGYMKI